MHGRREGELWKQNWEQRIWTKVYSLQISQLQKSFHAVTSWAEGKRRVFSLSASLHLPHIRNREGQGGRSKNSSVTTARLSSKTLLNSSKARILCQIHKQVIYKTPEQVPKLSVKEKQEFDEIYCPKSALSVRGFILFGSSCNVLLNVIVKHKKIFIHKYSVTYWTYNELHWLQQQI